MEAAEEEKKTGEEGSLVISLIFSVVVILLMWVIFQLESKTKLKSQPENKIPASEVVAVKVVPKPTEYERFREAVGMRESSNRYYIVNTLGYLGKYQFGKSTLRRFGITDI